MWGAEPNKCERLQQVVHCRNCEIFRQAGRTVFDREILQDDVSLWTHQIAKLKEEIDKSDMSVLSFRLDKHWFALPTQIFNQISQDGYTHQIPHKTKSRGVKLVNVGGTIYICLSLKTLLGLESEATKGEAPGNRKNSKRLMLVDIEGESYVLTTDEIGGVFRVDSSKIKSAQSPGGINQRLIIGTVKVAGLDCQLIEQSQLANVIDAALDEVL